MGYSTSIYLDLRLREGKTFDDFKNELKKYPSSKNSYDYDFSIVMGDHLELPDSEMRLYDNTEFANILAKFFNGEIIGQGDETDDKWRFTMLNGRVVEFGWEWSEIKSYRVD